MCFRSPDLCSCVNLSEFLQFDKTAAFLQQTRLLSDRPTQRLELAV